MSDNSTPLPPTPGPSSSNPLRVFPNTLEDIFNKQIAEDWAEFEQAILGDNLELRRELGFHVGYSAACGTYYGSPMHEELMRGANVLDIGCGFAAWCRSMAKAYPHSSFVACDNVRRFDEDDERVPPNMTFSHTDALSGLPYAAETFDFIIMRAFLSGLPKTLWPTLRAEIMRLLKPGGWLEVIDANAVMEPAGPVTKTLGQYIDRVFQRADLPLPITDNAPDFLFEEKQLVDIRCINEIIPAGHWAGWQGTAMRENDVLVVDILEPIITASLEISVEEYREMSVESARQHEEYKACAVAIRLYGQKKFK